MATTFTVYDIQTHATPSIDPPSQAPTLVIQFHMTHELKVQRRTPEGNVETDYPTVNAPGFQDSFTVPRHVVASFTLFDPYVFFRLSDMEIDPTLSDPLKQRIVDSTYDAAHPYLNTDDGIQITLQLKMTTTLELDSSPAMYDLMVSLFGEEAVIMEDGGRSVLRRRRRDASNAAAIDGLKTEVLFSNGDCEECAVCLEEFVEGTEVAHMPCSHVFHHNCIVPWLERNHSCPMCRFVASDH